MPSILLTDDDLELTQLLSEYLTGHGIEVTIANDGKTALAEVQKQVHDLMVLDIMMPEMDGLEVLRELQHTISIPTIMLTAKGDDIDRIIGLELGADDYLSKPCNPRELLARINAVLRRSTPPVKFTDTKDSILTIQVENRTCYLNEKELILTSAEFDLLLILSQEKGQVVSKSYLSQQVLGRDLGMFDRSIDVHISRLRKKLEAHHSEAIKTIRGKGYQLIL